MPEPAIGSESTEWGTEGGIVDPRSVDEYPIENSRNLVRSGGVFDAIQAGGGGEERHKTNLMDFSNWNNGVFRELVDGVSAYQNYAVSFDEQDRPVMIRDSVGHECVIRWDPLPVAYIQVTTLPGKTTYTDGETLDYSGIVVTAYDENDRALLEIPFAELVFTESEAEMPELDTYAKFPDTTYYISDGQANIGKSRRNGAIYWRSHLAPTGMRFITIKRIQQYGVISVSLEPFSSGCYYGEAVDVSAFPTADIPVQDSWYGSKTKDGVRYYYCDWRGGGVPDTLLYGGIEMLYQPQGYDETQLINTAIEMCYGENASRGTPQGTQTLPVKWRNGSSILETSFDILVFEGEGT